MRFIEKIPRVEQIFLLDNTLFIDQKNEVVEVINTRTKKSIEVISGSGYRYGNNTLGVIRNGKVDFYNSDLEKIGEVNSKEIKHDNTGVLPLDNDTWVIIISTEVNRRLINKTLIYQNNELIKTEENAWGAFLSSEYRLHYHEGTFVNPSYFRCSNLTDSHTYFEYQCENEGVITGKYNNGSPLLWKDKLVFGEHSIGNHRLKILDVKTGELIFEEDVFRYDFNFDVERGLIVSLWGKHTRSVTSKFYQVINLENWKYEIGGPLTENVLKNVESSLNTQFLYENKLYFFDNPLMPNGKENPIRIGRFDIITKKIDFIQDIPKAGNTLFYQILYNDKKLYALTANNELFVYEVEE